MSFKSCNAMNSAATKYRDIGKRMFIARKFSASRILIGHSSQRAVGNHNVVSQVPSQNYLQTIKYRYKSTQVVKQSAVALKQQIDAISEDNDNDRQGGAPQVETMLQKHNQNTGGKAEAMIRTTSRQYKYKLPVDPPLLPVRSEFQQQNYNNANAPLSTRCLQEMDIGEDFHHQPQCTSDRVALAIVMALRKPSDIFFGKRYLHRALLLESVAAVPGFVSGLLRHLDSLRNLYVLNDAVIHHLIHEAENERMHLITWLAIAKPNLFDRFLVSSVQALFFGAYFIMYLVAPRTCHRVVGHLESQAIISYTAFAQEIERGNIENVPAPQFAIKYWNLQSDAKLYDVVLAVRADEASHRDFNHHLADKMDQM
ncbi:hypothetical protein MIR68_011681 [Amoeboaphelidium protococcarum]|nr:hypothetical protein MIR68_011681 [Amoeboaphelidium protococcarum]